MGSPHPPRASRFLDQQQAVHGGDAVARPFHRINLQHDAATGHSRRDLREARDEPGQRGDLGGALSRLKVAAGVSIAAGALTLILAGVSLNDIAASTNDKVAARLTTVTDTYNLFGQRPPSAPYSAPSSVSSSVTNSDGTTSTDTADNTTLLGNAPLARNTTTITDSTSVDNRWKLKGSYFTMRAGPSVTLQFTTRFKASVSAGLAMVYAGSNYTVVESFEPETGAEIKETVTDETTKFRLGYYADATLQFDATERTGFYVGAVYQATGSYDQVIATANANYVSKIDLSNLNGLRAGLTFRF